VDHFFADDVYRKRFFFGRPSSPGAVMAAKTKAQGIIDDNAVGTFSLCEKSSM
jgi:hypothetical protein